MITEKWDILDDKGNSTGKTTIRGRNSLRNGEYHLVVHIWIISSDNKVLIQRRSSNKKLMPGEWAATGGAAVAGEDSFNAAKRELYEELGIQSTEKSLKKILRLKRRNSWLDIWLTECDIPIKDLLLQESEVSEAKWVTFAQLHEMIKKGDFHNYGNVYFNNVFSKIENYRGSYL